MLMNSSAQYSVYTREQPVADGSPSAPSHSVEPCLTTYLRHQRDVRKHQPRGLVYRSDSQRTVGVHANP